MTECGSVSFLCRCCCCWMNEWMTDWLNEWRDKLAECAANRGKADSDRHCSRWSRSRHHQSTITRYSHAHSLLHIVAADITGKHIKGKSGAVVSCGLPQNKMWWKTALWHWEALMLPFLLLLLLVLAVQCTRSTAHTATHRHIQTYRQT